MALRARFFFSGTLFFVALATIQAALVPGQTYVLKFVDVDGHVLSTAEGRTTVVVLTTSADTTRARVVGDRIPDFCLANPNYRMITILNLNRKYQRFARRTATWLIRLRLNAEANRLQQRYEVRKIQPDARRDVFAVADFDGALTSQLGAKPAEATFAVFVFGRDGKLLRQWNEVPSAAELAAAL
ncbi:MAG: hypothetical protein ABR514_09825 [Chthoniobacterales bacterium]